SRPTTSAETAQNPALGKGIPQTAPSTTAPPDARMDSALWRALAVFRGLGLAYAVLIYALRNDEYRHPLTGWSILALMAVWSVVVSLALRDPRRRTWPLLSTDLAVAVAAVVSSRWVDDPHRIAQGAQTLPVVWAAAPVLAFALRGGWRAGLVG